MGWDSSGLGFHVRGFFIVDFLFENLLLINLTQFFFNDFTFSIIEILCNLVKFRILPINIFNIVRWIKTPQDAALMISRWKLDFGNIS